VIAQRRGAADARIARLTVRGAADAVSARLGIERQLGALELRPAGLPPSAILCVRELRDPRPGTLPLASRALRPPPAWEQAMQREVDRLARAASRPVLGAVPATAAAVVFADEAELLACLGGDLVAGAIGARWWWPLLVEGIAEPRRATIAAWRQSAEHAPAALRMLAERGEAAAFVRVLGDADARDLADAIARRFALPAAGATWPSPEAVVAEATGGVPPSARSMEAVEAEAARQDAGAAQVSAGAAAPPWQGVAPETEAAGLSIEQRVLLGVGLTVARVPSLARSTGFAVALAAWRAAEASPRAQDHAPEPAPAWPRTRGAWALESTARAPESTVARAARSPIDTASRKLPVKPSIAGEARPRTSAPREPSALPITESAATTDLAPRAGEAALLAAAHAAGAADPVDAAASHRPLPSSSRERPPMRVRDRDLGAPITTGLGGLFYLVNLALHLRLYRDGHRDGDGDLALPLWDFVALVGRALLGDSAGDDDPVWPLLAELAGRADGEPPGAGFEPPADWQIPPAWLATFDPDSADMVDSAGAMPPPRTPLDRWLARLLPCLRARLQRALGTTDTELPALLLAHRARVHATATHVDVVLSLEALPVAIRFAGLDRDPGWIPAAGRFLAFHFE